MYPGRGQNMSASECKIYDCDLNTAVYSREQVGSSFKPYVLAAAVVAGHERPDQHPEREPVRCTSRRRPTPLVLVRTTEHRPRPCPSSFEVSNDGGEVIGNEARRGDQRAERAGAVVQHGLHRSRPPRRHGEHHPDGGQTFGVNIAAFPAGSNLSQLKGQVGMALGTALADRQRAGDHAVHDRQQRHVPPGARHQVVAAPDGTVQTSPVAMHQVLVPGPRLAGPVRDGDDHRRRNGHRRVARP